MKQKISILCYDLYPKEKGRRRVPLEQSDERGRKTCISPKPLLPSFAAVKTCKNTKNSSNAQKYEKKR